jgi:hypothetical protein
VRPKDGTPVVVKKPTKLVHDFRRTAARSLIRAGVPEVPAMALLGHATNSIFKRYAIVDAGMRQVRDVNAAVLRRRLTACRWTERGRRPSERRRPSRKLDPTSLARYFSLQGAVL